MGLFRKERQTGEIVGLECPPGFEPHSEFVFYADSAEDQFPYEPDPSDILPGEALEVAARRQLDDFNQRVIGRLSIDERAPTQ